MPPPTNVIKTRHGRSAYREAVESPYAREKPSTPETDGGFWSDLDDIATTEMSLRTGWDLVQRSIARQYGDQPTPENFNPLDNLPEEYHGYAEDFAFARTPSEVNAIIEIIETQTAARERLSHNGGLHNFGLTALALVFDPINLIGGPALGGAGKIRAAIQGGAVLGGVNAGAEAFRNYGNPVVSDAETAFNIASAFVVAGAISAGISAFSKNGKYIAPSDRVEGSIPEGVISLSAERTRKLQRAIDSTNGVILDADDFAALQGSSPVRVVPISGEVDSAGRPRLAYTTSAEAAREKASMRAAALAEEEQAAAVSKAADDALGDVIPDGPAPEGISMDTAPGVTMTTRRVDDVEASVDPNDARFADGEEEAARLSAYENEAGMVPVRDALDDEVAPQQFELELARPDPISENPAAGLDAEAAPVAPTSRPTPSQQSIRELEPERLEVSRAVDDIVANSGDELAEAYGVPAEEARARLVDDIFLALQNGLESIAEGSRKLVKKAIAAIVAGAMIFNPAALTPSSASFLSSQQAMAAPVTKVIPESARGEMSHEAGKVYAAVAKLAEGEKKAFIIVDKNDGKIHLFKEGGDHLGSLPALTGKERGDVLSAERQEFSTLSQFSDADRVTPAGVKSAKLYSQASNVDSPILALRGPDGEANMISIHQNTASSGSRVTALGTASGSDNAVTYGCITLSSANYDKMLRPNIASFDGATVFVMPHDAAVTGKLLPDAELPRVSDVAPDGMPLKAPDGVSVSPAIRERQTMQRETGSGGRRRDGADPRNGSGPRPRADEAEAPESTAARSTDEIDDGFEDTIYIDYDGIRASFASKPWTQERLEGVDPLPENAFKSEEEWLYFVLAHELNHVKTKRLPTESKAAYENRINTMAMDEFLAAKGSMAPTDDTIIDRFFTRFGSVGNLRSLVGNHRATHQFVQDLNGDMATLSIGNRMGAATTPGGSVFQRSMMLIGRSYASMYAWRTSYSKYLRGYAASSNLKVALDNTVARVPVFGSRARQNKMGHQEFRDIVGMAARFDGEFELPDGRTLTPEEWAIVREASDVTRQVLIDFGDEASFIGVFSFQKRLQRRIEWHRAKIEEVKLKMRSQDSMTDSQIEGLVSLINEWSEKINFELSRLDGRNPNLVKSLKKRIKEAEEKIDNAYEPRPKSPGQLDGLQSRINELGARMDELEARLAKSKEPGGKPKGADRYWFRIFDQKKVAKHKERLTRMIEERYALDEPQGARERAEKTVARIQKDHTDHDIASLEVGKSSPMPSPTSSRQLPLSDEELKDFLVWDVETVIGVYARRMAPAIEMTRKYGSIDAERGFDDVRLKLVMDGVDEKTIEKVVWELEVARDRTLGNLHTTDPLNFSNRAVRLLRNLTYLQTMGSSVEMQVADIGRTLANEGYGPLFQGLQRAIGQGLSKAGPIPHSRAVGEGYEVANARAAAAMIESDSALLVTNQTAIERWAAQAQPVMFNANLMAPLTVIQKDASSFATASRLMTEAKMLAKAVNEGRTRKTFTPEEMKKAEELASWGISLRDAQLIADMPSTKPDELYYIDLEEWAALGKKGERAAEIFKGAMSGNIRSNVITPGGTQRPAIFDGIYRGPFSGERKENPWLSLPFQILSFTFGSQVKIGHGLSSGRDRNRAVTIATLLVSGYISSWLANESWEYMGWDDVAADAFRRSGLAMVAGDAIGRLETLTNIGPSKALGLYQHGEDTISDEVGAVGGVGVGIWTAAVEAAFSEDMDTDQRVGAFRRLFPFNSLIWIDGRLKEWTERAAASGVLETEEFDDPEEAYFDAA